MKKIIRTSLLIICLGSIVLIGKSKWIEFCDRPARDRYSHPFYKKSVHFVRKALGVAPFAAVHYALANSYLDEGLVNQAVEEYKKTLQMDKRFVQAYLALGDIYFGRASYKEALELLQQAEAVVSGNPALKELKRRVSFEYFRDEGVKSFGKGDPIKARDLLKGALEADQNSAQVHYLIALSFDEQRDFNRVEDHLRKAISLDPKYYLARSFLGDLYFGKGDFEAAIEQYQSSLAIYGENPAVLNNLGLAYMNLESYYLAMLSLEKAVALDPGNVGFRYNLAAVCRDFGELEKAAKGFIIVIRINPGYPSVHNDLGDIYRKQGRNSEAFKEFRATIEQGQKRISKNISDPLLLVELAYAYNEIKELDKAEKLVNQALRLDPTEQRAYLILASIYRSTNRYEAALAELEKAKKTSSRKYFYIDEAIEETQKQMAHSRR
ncbi:MAG: tetratricopeptide repeat protein [Candidatus Omnitrophota bacterium]